MGSQLYKNLTLKTSHYDDNIGEHNDQYLC